MTAITKASVKAYFETGDLPTQAQFEDLIDSYQDASTVLDGIVSAVSGAVSGLFLTTNGSNGITPVSAGAVKTSLGLATTSDVEFNTITVSALSAKSAVFSGVVSMTTANITGNVAVSGDAAVRNITVSSNATINGQLTVGGNVVSASGIAMGGNTLSGALLTNAIDSFVSSNVGTFYSLDMRIPMHRILLTTASCSITFTNTTAAVAAGRLSVGLMAKQDGTGSRKIEWKAPSGGVIRPPSNTLPTLTVSASTQDRFEIETFDGTTLFLYTCGQNF